jgi:MFS superfamily sulfate permease-like transporter
LLARFPRAALGAVVVFAATRLVDVGGFRRIARFRRSEAMIALITAVAVLTVGVLYGVLVAVGVWVLDLLYRLARPHDGVLGYVPGVAGMHDVDDYPDARPARVPLRRAAVLRQGRGLPPPGTGHPGHCPGAAMLVPAQCRGE